MHEKRENQGICYLGLLQRALGSCWLAALPGDGTVGVRH
jgi:hypothetical protein